MLAEGEEKRVEELEQASTFRAHILRQREHALRLNMSGRARTLTGRVGRTTAPRPLYTQTAGRAAFRLCQSADRRKEEIESELCLEKTCRKTSVLGWGDSQALCDAADRREVTGEGKWPAGIPVNMDSARDGASSEGEGRDEVHLRQREAKYTGTSPENSVLKRIVRRRNSPQQNGLFFHKGEE